MNININDNKENLINHKNKLSKREEEFIKKSKNKFGNKYDYSELGYINYRNPITLICPKHGNIKIMPSNHLLSNTGCPDCSLLRTKELLSNNTDSFIERAKKIHGNKYDYSLVNYENLETRVIIKCKEHNITFQQTPSSHLAGHGCPICGKISAKVSLDDFIKRSKNKFGDRYNYDKVDLINMTTPVIITCNKPGHGDFEITPHRHLISKGGGCTKCNGGIKITKDDFIKKSIKIHGDRYNYSEVNYINSSTPVKILCPEHGYFFQQPIIHSTGHGCPKCSKIYRIEESIEIFLKESNILFETQKSWDWLVFHNPQKVDFYLPNYDIVIECQGKQHFEDVEFFDKKSTLEDRKKMDKNKLDLCTEHGLTVLYFSNLSNSVTKYNYPYKVYEDTSELLEEILKHKKSA